MIRIYEWIGIPMKVINEQVENDYKFEKAPSKWRVGRSAYCVDSPVFLYEIQVCVLLLHSRGYRIGGTETCIVKKTHSLL